MFRPGDAGWISDPLPTLAPPELAAHLLGGSAALFPTDTLPALASCPSQAHQLWALKHRPAEKPLILMAANAEALLGSIGRPARPEWLAMAAWAWPGAVTLVLPAIGPVAEALNPGGGSLGLRLPACPQALALLNDPLPFDVIPCFVLRLRDVHLTALQLCLLLQLFGTKTNLLLANPQLLLTGGTLLLKGLPELRLLCSCTLLLQRQVAKAKLLLQLLLEIKLAATFCRRCPKLLLLCRLLRLLQGQPTQPKLLPKPNLSPTCAKILHWNTKRWFGLRTNQPHTGPAKPDTTC